VNQKLWVEMFSSLSFFYKIISNRPLDQKVTYFCSGKNFIKKKQIGKIFSQKLNNNNNKCTKITPFNPSDLACYAILGVIFKNGIHKI
jgi:hypothetical protein